MLIFLGILLLYFSPIILVFCYAKYEYHYSLQDNFKQWKVGKTIGILLFLFLTFLIFTTDSSQWRLKVMWYLLWEPGLSISLIVFSKPASEILAGFSSYFSYGEDFGYIIGWFGLISAFAWLGIVTLRYS